MNGAEKDYKFGQKNNWRRQVWNEISRRVLNRRNATVLYLAGEQDLDRKIALEHGFKSDNLIIVERDRRICEKLRSEGKVVINAELTDVLLSWPKKGPAVDVVHADLCSGLEPDTQGIVDALEHPAFNNAVVMVNLMRGRDPRTNILRLLIGKAVEDEEEKHRGKQLIAWAALEILNVAFRGEKAVYKRNEMDGKTISHISLRTPKGEVEKYIYRNLVDAFRPAYPSYKSGPLVMDSVIFESPFKMVSIPIDPLVFRADSEAQRMISAALAVLNEVNKLIPFLLIAENSHQCSTESVIDAFV